MFWRATILTTVSAMASMTWYSDSRAQIIDFETTPSGIIPEDNAQLGLDDGYVVGGSTVTFGFDVDLDGIPETMAVFEQVGENDTGLGFLNNCLGLLDTPDPGFEAQLGVFFMRPPANTDFGKFVIDYSGVGVVTAASGEIWDMDGNGSDNSEQFRVQAFNSSGDLLATIDSPNYTTHGCDDSLDGEPWLFQFTNLNGIARITIDFTGTRTTNIGLAFNNFDALGALPVEAATWGDIKAIYR